MVAENYFFLINNNYIKLGGGGSSSSKVYCTCLGPIFLDNVACRGTESSLFDCSHNGLGIHNCRHYEDAGVECSSESLRLLIDYQ